jgi:hypothetical protein
MAVGPTSSETPKLPKTSSTVSENYHKKITSQDAQNCRAIGKMLAMIGDQVNSLGSQQSIKDSVIQNIKPTVVKLQSGTTSK